MLKPHDSLKLERYIFSYLTNDRFEYEEDSVFFHPEFGSLKVILRTTLPNLKGPGRS